MTNKNEQSLELTENSNNNNNNDTSTSSCSGSASSSSNGSNGFHTEEIRDTQFNGPQNGCSHMNGKDHDQTTDYPSAAPFNYAIELNRGDFKPEKCFYPQTLNSIIHPIVKKFFEMDSDAIACRYAQLNPVVEIDRLRECLNYKPKYFKWSGGSCLNSCFIFLFLLL